MSILERLSRFRAELEAERGPVSVPELVAALRAVWPREQLAMLADVLELEGELEAEQQRRDDFDEARRRCLGAHEHRPGCSRNPLALVFLDDGSQTTVGCRECKASRLLPGTARANIDVRHQQIERERELRRGLPPASRLRTVCVKLPRRPAGSGRPRARRSRPSAKPRGPDDGPGEPEPPGGLDPEDT